MKNTFVIYFFSMISSFSFSQEEQIYGVERREKVNIQYLPEKGTFITIQIASLGEGFIYDDNFVSSFVLINPVYLKKNGESYNYSVGIYSTDPSASAQLRLLNCIYRGAFLRAYHDGEQMDLSEFTVGDVPEVPVNFLHAKSKIQEVLADSYYRIQAGYYEKKKLKRKEQKVYDLLAENGFTFEPEQHPDPVYSSGRVFLSTEKFATLEEAQSAKQKMEELIGREVLIIPYCKDIGVELSYLHELARCLKIQLQGRN